MRTLLKALKLACGTFLTVVLLGGCIWGVKKVEITHGPLNPIQNKREGIIGVKPFTDAREGNRRKNGTVYVAAGTVGSVELKGDSHLGDIFAGYVVETLENAGYQAVIMDFASSGTNSAATEKVPVILEGLISKFSVNTMPLSTVEVTLLLRDAENEDVLWSTTIYGYGEGTLWTGAQSEFEDFVRQAVDEALNQAATEFVSDAFYEKIKRTNSPPVPNTMR